MESHTICATVNQQITEIQALLQPQSMCFSYVSITGLERKLGYKQCSYVRSWLYRLCYTWM